jgi:tetratricopeptide (TPR) repeat protein
VAEGSTSTRRRVLCQTCGAGNTDDQEFCSRCHQKLLVLSGASDDDLMESTSNEESFSFDEHLLERISILEEVVKRTAETVRQVLGGLYKQEKNLLVTQTGVSTLRELLERKAVFPREEWNDLWEARMDYQLLALEKRERFMAIKDRIAALYRGNKRKVFLQHLEDAEYALFAFDVERALTTLETAHRLDRDNYELAFYIGETHFNEGASAEALQYFQRVLEVKPDHYEGLIYSGVILHERGEQERAEGFLKRAVTTYPDTFLPHFSLGAVYASQGNLARAVVFLEKAVGIDRVPQAMFLLGSCYHEMGKATLAVKWLEETIRHDPGFEEAHHLLGLAYLDRHWRKKALESFRQAQRLNPRKMQYRDLVRYLSGSDGFPLPEVEGEAGDAFRRAEEMVAHGNLKRALTQYRRALSMAPDNPTLLMSYALLCLHLDRNQEIETVARKVLTLNPSEMLRATAYATLIEALRAEGKFREGNRVGNEMLERGESDFARTIAYYEMAFNLAELEEDLDQALDFARRSLEISPEELKQFPLAALGWVHYKRQEYPQAVDFLSRSNDIDSSQTTLTHLGMALLAAGEERQARDVLAQAHNRAKSDGGAVEQRMMECMKDSTRLLNRVRNKQRK